MLKKLFNFGKEEFDLKQKVKKIIKCMGKTNGKDEFIEVFNEFEVQELLDDILIELGMLDKKGCYSVSLVDDIIKGLEKRGIYLEEDDKTEKVLSDFTNFLYDNLMSLPAVIRSLRLENKNDINILIKILNDPTIDSTALNAIVKALLKKREFIKTICFNFHYIVDTIQTHKSFNLDVLDEILLYRVKKETKKVKDTKQNKNNYFSRSSNKIRKKENSLPNDDLDLMFFKSYFIVYHNIDLSRYRTLLEGEYLTVIKSVLENSRLDLEKKELLILKLKLDTLNILSKYINTIYTPDIVAIKDFINLALVLKDTNISLSFKENYIKKLHKDDLKVLKNYLDSEYCDITDKLELSIIVNELLKNSVDI